MRGSIDCEGSKPAILLVRASIHDPLARQRLAHFSERVRALAGLVRARPGKGEATKQRASPSIFGWGLSFCSVGTVGRFIKCRDEVESVDRIDDWSFFLPQSQTKLSSFASSAARSLLLLAAVSRLFLCFFTVALTEAMDAAPTPDHGPRSIRTQFPSHPVPASIGWRGRRAPAPFWNGLGLSADLTRLPPQERGESDDDGRCRAARFSSSASAPSPADPCGPFRRAIRLTLSPPHAHTGGPAAGVDWDFHAAALHGRAPAAGRRRGHGHRQSARGRRSSPPPPPVHDTRARTRTRGAGWAPPSMLRARREGNSRR